MALFGRRVNVLDFDILFSDVAVYAHQHFLSISCCLWLLFIMNFLIDFVNLLILLPSEQKKINKILKSKQKTAKNQEGKMEGRGS